MLRYDNGITIWDDGPVYPYGTKQRVAVEFIAMKIAQTRCDEFVTFGTSFGMGSWAFLDACIKNGVKGTVFLDGERIPQQIMSILNYNGFNWNHPLIKIHSFPLHTHGISNIALDYTSESPLRCFINSGFHEPEYQRLLYNNIMNDPLLKNVNPSRVWVPVGSGTLASVLKHVFPQSVIIGVIPTGSRNHPACHYLDICFYSEEPFENEAIYPPPYESTSHYDAKLWVYILQYGQNGDLIWNVK